MKNVCKWLVALLMSPSLIWAAVSIPDLSLRDVDGQRGVVWETPSPIKVEGNLVIPTGVDVSAVHLVATVGSSTSRSAGQELPTQLGGGLMLTMTGRITITDENDGRTWQWRSDGLRQPVAASGSLRQLAGGTRKTSDGARFSFRGEVRPVVVCSALPCQIASGPRRIPAISLRLIASDASGPITDVQGSPAAVVSSGSTTVKASCTFGVSPSVVDFGSVVTKRAGHRLAQASTKITATCWRNEDGDVWVRFKPSSGTHTGEPNSAVLSNPGLGLRFNIAKEAGCTSDSSLRWDSDKNKLGALRRDSMEAMTMSGGGQVNWALCQRTAKPAAGKFHGSVNYELWVD